MMWPGTRRRRAASAAPARRDRWRPRPDRCVRRRDRRRSRGAGRRHRCRRREHLNVERRIVDVLDAQAGPRRQRPVKPRVARSAGAARRPELDDRRRESQARRRRRNVGGLGPRASGVVAGRRSTSPRHRRERTTAPSANRPVVRLRSRADDRCASCPRTPAMVVPQLLAGLYWLIEITPSSMRALMLVGESHAGSGPAELPLKP